MINDAIAKQLQNIIRGTLVEGFEDHCTKVRNLLNQSFETGATVKSEFESKSILKEEQASFLKSYAEKSGFLLPSLPGGSAYLTRGGEAEVYLAADLLNVIKVNDGVYYATWTEFFNSMVIHNLLFPFTAYTLLGFIENKGKLCVACSNRL